MILMFISGYFLQAYIASQAKYSLGPNFFL